MVESGIVYSRAGTCPLEPSCRRLSDYWASLKLQDSHISALSHYIAFYGHGLTFDGLNSIRTQYTSSMELPLLHLLSVTLGYQTTGPRDKVYALLGICRPKDRDALVPDYRKTCSRGVHSNNRAFN